MSIAVVTKTIRAKSALWDDATFRRDLQLANKAEAQAMRRDYQRCTKTWEHEVKFEQITTSRGPDLVVIIGTDDPIFRYVNAGTRVRRALMSPDFEAKTRPGSLDSRPGQGGVVFISRTLELPGIEARDFTGQITRQHTGPYKRRIEQAMKRARSRAARM